jgi:type I restriction enzyme R subunit
MNKRELSERDICSKFITPAIVSAGWDLHTQIREELSFTKGRIIVRGKLHTRGKQKRADYVLYYKSNIPIAVIEAKENNLSVGSGMQQALDYAETLDVPFVFSSNGDAFLMHDRTGSSDKVEQELSLDAFPSPEELWGRFCKWKGVDTPEAKNTVGMPYYDDGAGRSPRYYQVNAVNRAIEAVASGANRILLVMATGTGKTYNTINKALEIIFKSDDPSQTFEI